MKYETKRVGNKNMFSQESGDWTVYFSYWTPVAMFNRFDNRLYVNSQKYSHTSTRHLSTVYGLTGYPPVNIPLTQREMFEKVRGLGIVLHCFAGDSQGYSFGTKVSRW